MFQVLRIKVLFLFNVFFVGIIAMTSFASSANEANPVVAIVQKQVERYNARDLEGFLDTYSDDIKILDFPAEPSMSDKAKMREGYGRLFTAEKLNATIINRIVFDNKVIDHERVTVTRDGKDRSFEAVAIYEVNKANKISRVTFISPPRPQPPAQTPPTAAPSQQK